MSSFRKFILKKCPKEIKLKYTVEKNNTNKNFKINDLANVRFALNAWDKTHELELKKYKREKTKEKSEGERKPDFKLDTQKMRKRKQTFMFSLFHNKNGVYLQHT